MSISLMSLKLIIESRLLTALANESLRTGLGTFELGPELLVVELDVVGKVTLEFKVARSEACNVLGAVGAVELVVDVRGLGLGLTALATGWFPSGADGKGTLRLVGPLVVNSSAGGRDAGGVGLGGRRAAGGGEPGEPLESIVALRERTEGDITAACGTCGDPLTLPWR